MRINFKRVLRQSITIILIITVTTLVMLEIVLRLTSPYRPVFFEPDDQLGSWYIANAEYFWSAGEGCPGWMSSGRISSQRLKDREYPYERQPNTFRILVVGDSYTDSLHLPAELNWLELLEMSLNQRNDGITYEVINGGLSGSGTSVQYLFYHHAGYRFQPDLVLQLMIFNDFTDSSSYYRGSMPIPSYKIQAGELVLNQKFLQDDFYRVAKILQPFRTSSYLVNMFVSSYGWELIQSNRGIISQSQGKRVANEWLPEELEATEIVKQLTSRLKQEVEQNGSRYLLLLGSSWTYTNYDRVSREEVDKDPFADLNGVMSPWLKEMNIPYVDLTPPLREYSLQHEVLMHGCVENDGLGHWSPIGNQVVAQVVYDFLQTDNWLQP